MRLKIVSAVNKPEVLANNLLASPGISDVDKKEGYISAATAYNAALCDSDGIDPIAFIHQDVYLPEGWSGKVGKQIELIERDDPNWAVLGVWGCRTDRQFSGRVYCAATEREHVGIVPAPTPVQSVDEVVIILNAKLGLRFDEGLSGFHLYGTDIILEAERRGFRSYAIEAPVVHNSTYRANIYDSTYFRAQRFMRRKWYAQLPIYTCCAPITRSGAKLCHLWLHAEIHRRLKPNAGRCGAVDPKAIAQTLNYEPASSVSA